MDRNPLTEISVPFTLEDGRTGTAFYVAGVRSPRALSIPGFQGGRVIYPDDEIAFRVAKRHYENSKRRTYHGT